MANTGALMGIGAGLTAAGQAIDRSFQMRMEQMRQDSLRNLESRRLDLMGQEIKDRRDAAANTLASSTRESYYDRVEKFDLETQKEIDRIISGLPRSQRSDIMARVIAVVARTDPTTLIGLTGTNEDGVKQTEAEMMADMASAMVEALVGTVAENDAPNMSKKLARFGMARLKKWNALQALYPEIKGEARTFMDFYSSATDFYPEDAADPPPPSETSGLEVGEVDVDVDTGTEKRNSLVGADLFSSGPSPSASASMAPGVGGFIGSYIANAEGAPVRSMGIPSPVGLMKVFRGSRAGIGLGDMIGGAVDSFGTQRMPDRARNPLMNYGPLDTTRW
jgi:hypothetical protein